MTQLGLTVSRADGAADAPLGVGDLSPLNITCTPESIQTGLSCGMSDMCGEDPCLCGAADEYGCCACNGTETTVAQVSVVSSDPASVQVLQVGGGWYLLGVGSGEAEVTVTATLVHYGQATQTVQVVTGGVGALVYAALALLLLGGFALAALRRRRRAGHRPPRKDAGAEGGR